jgi:hypothetical protein
MKKSILAMLFVLFGVCAVPFAYAEDLPQINGDDAVEQLPPLTDPAASADSES